MQQSTTTLSLHLDYDADEDWPFAFRAEQEFAIEADSLSVTLRLINTGEHIMPGGLGWHPFFRADLSRQVTSDARLVFPLDTIDVPTGAPAMERCSGALQTGAGETQHFTDWQQAAVRTDGGAGVTLARTAGLAHLAVHRTATYVCLEPVSHRAGVLHQPECPAAEDALTELPPGCMLEGCLDLHILPHGDRTAP